jgi:hypothetical protein
MPVPASPASTTVEQIRSTQAHRGTPPGLERQIHRACGDVRAALFGALELLSGATVRRAGRDDVFRASSDLAHAQRHVALALQATNLLDQMVGTPAQHRQPWSYYRGRIGQEAASCGPPTGSGPQTAIGG